jgi:hypothetical protein
MFAISGAPIDEVWGVSRKGTKPFKPSRRINSGQTKVYDDIIDAYIDDFQPSAYQPELSTSPPNVVRQESQASSLSQSMNNYMISDEKPNQCQPKRSRRCNTNVAPIVSSDLTEDALEYQRFFKHDNMFVQSEKEVVDEEYTIPDAVTPESQYVNTDYELSQETPYINHHVDPETIQSRLPYISAEYEPAKLAYQQSSTEYYIELLLYIISGILLIFILEQILHLGLYLR